MTNPQPIVRLVSRDLTRQLDNEFDGEVFAISFVPEQPERLLALSRGEQTLHLFHRNALHEPLVTFMRHGQPGQYSEPIRPTSPPVGGSGRLYLTRLLDRGVIRDALVYVDAAGQITVMVSSALHDSMLHVELDHFLNADLGD